MSWRCAAKSETGGAFCPQPAAAIAARIRDCAMLRTPNNSADCAATKAAWCETFESLLSRRRDCVHVTQTIGQGLHDMRGEMRRLLNEKMEPAPVDLRQAGRSLGHYTGGARAIVDQRHLTNQRTRFHGLQHEVAQ